MIIGGEQGTEHTVDQTTGENLIVRSLTLALGETTGETSCGGILLSVVYLQRHEICSGNCIFCGTNSSQQHGVVHTENNTSIGLLCHFPGFNGDGSSIRQLNTFRNYVHLVKKHLK